MRELTEDGSNDSSRSLRRRSSCFDGSAASRFDEGRRSSGHARNERGDRLEGRLSRCDDGRSEKERLKRE